jgi:putative serine/threonine protein kinase
LDRIGLDHGELSHAPKHVIVNDEDKPVIVDFESASLNRRPSNVTSICQFLFLGGEPAGILARTLGATDREMVLEALRRYKNDRTFENLERVLTALKL